MDARPAARQHARPVAKEKVKPGEQLIVKNRRASYDYELGDKFEAGIVLVGSEVKMLRDGTADLTDSWCAIQQGEAWLQGVNIASLPGMAFAHEAKRARKLLLHKSEIDAIRRAVEREGMSVAATKMYFKDGKVKVEIALARGKKVHDKRNAMRERDAEDDARAAMRRVRTAR